MKVKMLTVMAGERCYFAKGKIYDMKPNEAKSLIKAGFAESVDKRVVETSSLSIGDSPKRKRERPKKVINSEEM